MAHHNEIFTWAIHFKYPKRLNSFQLATKRYRSIFAPNIILKKIYQSIYQSIAQSVGAVEDTECTSTEE